MAYYIVYLVFRPLATVDLLVRPSLSEFWLPWSGWSGGSNLRKIAGGLLACRVFGGIGGVIYLCRGGVSAEALIHYKTLAAFRQHNWMKRYQLVYTGIVQGTETVIDIKLGEGFKTLAVSNNNALFGDAFVGASVALNGTCLTLTDVQETFVTFDVSDKTNSLTTLQDLVVGDEVNVERSHITGQENGGHSLYGHVGGIATVISVNNSGGTVGVRLELPADIIRYFFDKGFIGLHGASLTVHDVDQERSRLSVNLIPETLRLTSLSQLVPGYRVNVEVDHATRVMVDVITAAMRL
ncbi:TPA: riboflavin synthase subunit alpha [Serratia marcescens subsp. marcescens ATCC 13880]|uniref:riboflavin synthase subunit alpha n=1 Tax=Serratia TaxID=613 RepID=UPI0027E48C7E|nr:riboflavin synthase subunit alpha [Serratia marcescens]